MTDKADKVQVKIMAKLKMGKFKQTHRKKESVPETLVRFSKLPKILGKSKQPPSKTMIVGTKKALHNKMCDSAWKDLEKYRSKFIKYEIDTNYYPFFMQLKDAMHNLLQTNGFNVRTLNRMIKDCKIDVIAFEKKMFKEFVEESAIAKK